MATVRFRFTDSPMPGGKRMVPIKRASTRHQRPTTHDCADEQGEELEQEEQDIDPDDWELLQTFDAGHGCKFDDEGRLHVFRRRSSTTRDTHPDQLKLYSGKLKELWRRKP